jgi:hypothetical protein
MGVKFTHFSIVGYIFIYLFEEIRLLNYIVHIMSGNLKPP